MGSHSLPPTAATAPMSAVGQRQTGVTPLGHDALQGQPAKRRKPAIDRHLPLFVPEEHSGTRDSDEVLQSLRENYTSLEALEKKLDWTLSRKKAEYGELLGKSGTHTGQPKGKLGGVKRNLRLSLSHEISAATAQTGRAGPQAAANAAPRDDSVPDGGESKEQTSSGAVEADEQKVAQESPKGESSKPQQWSFKLSGLLQRPQDSEEEPKVHFSSLVTGVVVDILSEDPSNPSAADRIEVRVYCWPAVDPDILRYILTCCFSRSVASSTPVRATRWSHPVSPLSRAARRARCCCFFAPAFACQPAPQPTPGAIQTCRTHQSLSGHPRGNQGRMLACALGLHQKERAARQRQPPSGSVRSLHCNGQ